MSRDIELSKETKVTRDQSQKETYCDQSQKETYNY
jgi:hypothetical protein